MLSLVLRGFLQRKLRVLLTGIAIALGVATTVPIYVAEHILDEVC